jgi:hypothetical protein
MAKKGKRGKRAQPVQPKKQDDGKIRVPRVKQRGVMPPPVRYHHNRTADVSRGRRRRPKHKGKRGW